MKNFFKMMPALVLSSGLALAEDSKTPQQLAIEVFELAQKDSTIPYYQQVQEAIGLLAARGFTERSSSSAAYVSGSCGFIGCEDSFLVTTSYETNGANTQSTVISGLVFVRGVGEAEIRKVFKAPLMDLLKED